ncbi:MAG: hypothetical protein ACLT3D_05110 [Lawsonibacter sp.]
MANKEIKTIDLAETVEGKVTAYTEKKNVTVDGTKYEYSKNYTDAVKDDSNLSYDLNDAYTLVLDANGYVIYTDGTAGHNDYVYVAEIAPYRWREGRPGGRRLLHRRHQQGCCGGQR